MPLPPQQKQQKTHNRRVVDVESLNFNINAVSNHGGMTEEPQQDMMQHVSASVANQHAATDTDSRALRPLTGNSAAFSSRGHYFQEKQHKLDTSYKTNAIFRGLENVQNAVNVVTNETHTAGQSTTTQHDSNAPQNEHHYDVYIDTSVQRSFHLKHLLSSMFPNNFTIHQFYSTNKYLFICDTGALSLASLTRNRRYVDVQWLHDSMKEQKLLPLDKYALKRELTKKRVTHNANLDEFMAQSRLHLIGAWKYEMTSTYQEYLERAAKILKKDKKVCVGYDALIAHLDMDCFFAMVSIRSNPHLKDKPVAVSHSNNGSGDVSSCNYIARERGVKAGMWMNAARKLCPNLVAVPYDFEAYKKVSHQVYQILFKHCNVVQIVSIDEAYIDLSYQCKNAAEAMELIQRVRREIEQETQCTASAGICENILLARMVTKVSKPNGQQFLTKGDAITHLRKEPVRSIPGIGRVLQQKLKNNHNITHIRDLCDLSRSELVQLFKEQLGDMLYRTSRGIDNRSLDPLPVRKSVHVAMNYGHRYQHQEQVLAFLKKVAEETSSRLREYGVKGKQVVLKVRKRQEGAGEPTKYMGTGRVDALTKSESLADFTDNAEIIARTLCQMYETMDLHATDVRGLGCTIQQLDNYLCQDESNIRQSIVKFFEKSQQSKRSHVAQYHPQSMSQLDTEVFKQLPYNVQQEVLQVVKQKEQIKKGVSAMPAPKSKKRKATSSTTSSARKKQKIDHNQYQLTFYEKKKAIEDGAYSQYDAEMLHQLPPKMQAEIIQNLQMSEMLQKQKQRIQETYDEVNPLNRVHGASHDNSTTVDAIAGDIFADLENVQREISTMVSSGWIKEHADLFVELVMQFINAQLHDLMLESATKLYRVVKRELQSADQCGEAILQRLTTHIRSLLQEYCLGDELETAE